MVKFSPQILEKVRNKFSTVWLAVFNNKPDLIACRSSCSTNGCAHFYYINRLNPGCLAMTDHPGEDQSWMKHP